MSDRDVADKPLRPLILRDVDAGKVGQGQPASAMAEGLPEWDLVPPLQLVQRGTR